MTTPTKIQRKVADNLFVGAAAKQKYYESCAAIDQDRVSLSAERASVTDKERKAELDRIPTEMIRDPEMLARFRAEQKGRR